MIFVSKNLQNWFEVKYYVGIYLSSPKTILVTISI
jgi:hypothetical protein